MEKKRFWLKLEKNFLQSRFIKIIKKMPNGTDYILFYLALMLESIETIGHLRLSSLVPYDEKMLSSLTDTNIDIVRSALKLFSELGMITVLSDGTIFLPEIPAITGKECDSAERVRAFRLRQEQAQVLLCNNDVTKSNANIEYSISEQSKVKQNRADLLDKCPDISPPELKSIRDKNIKKLECPVAQDDDSQKIPYKEVVEYLNGKTGKKYRHDTAATKRLIRARVKEGFSLEDFKTVVDNKIADWKGTAFERYLTPTTLFSGKFDTYVNSEGKKWEEGHGKDWIDRVIDQG